MTLAVSAAVLADVQAQVAAHQAQVDEARKAFDAQTADLAAWQSILSDVYVAAPVVDPAPAPVVDSQPTPADAQGIG